MSALANRLIQKGFLKTDLIIDAFSEISRVEFVPERFAVIADDNVALPIGHGQTAPTPSVIAFMLELLRPERGSKVLVLGGGSGWVLALLSYIVGAKGHIVAVDDLDGLLTQAEQNIAKYSFIARDGIVEAHRGALEDGHSAGAPYDCVLIMRSLEAVPEAVVEQIGSEGRIVLPIKDIVTYCEKNSEELTQEPFSGVQFSQA